MYSQAFRTLIVRKMTDPNRLDVVALAEARLECPVVPFTAG